MREIVKEVGVAAVMKLTVSSHEKMTGASINCITRGPSGLIYSSSIAALSLSDLLSFHTVLQLDWLDEGAGFPAGRSGFFSRVRRSTNERPDSQEASLMRT